MLTKKLKLTVISILTVMLASSFSGCANKGEVETEGEVESKTSETAPIKKDFSGVKLRVSAYRNLQTDGNNKEYGMGAEEFKKAYPGAEIEFLVQGSTGDNEQVVAAVASGDPWDLQMVIGPAIPNAFHKDLYEPIDKYIDLKDPVFSKSTLAASEWQGKHYGVSSIWMNDIRTMIYNENMFKDMGIKTPHEYLKEGKWNWDAWFKILEDFKVKGQGGLLMDIDKPDVFNRYSHKWNPDGTAVDTWTSKEQTEYIDTWRRSLIDYGVARAWHADVYNRANPFILSFAPYLLNEVVSKKGESKDVVRYIPAPEKDGKVTAYMVDYQFAVPKGAKNPEAAMELAKFMIKARNEEIEKNYKANMLPEDFELLKKSAENGYIVHGVPGLPTPAWKTYEVDSKAGKPLSTLITENASPMKAAIDKWNAEIKK